MILRQLGGRAEHPRGSGTMTSTSPRLTQRDFEDAMAIAETHSGGQLKIKGPGGRPYRFGHWHARQADGATRSRRELARRIANTLMLTDRADCSGRVLDEGGNLLRGTIRQATGGRVDDIDLLTLAEAGKVIDGLKAEGKRHGVKWPREPRQIGAT